MKKQNYKFHINETAPVIPAAPAFGNLLKKANAQLRWYSKPWAWGGFTGIAVVTVVSGWWFMQANKFQAVVTIAL